MRQLKTVVHVHTDYSWDSNRPPESLIETAVAQGVDCVAVTDHDQIDGALAIRDCREVRVIVGEEVSTQDGHIIGLFLEERIPPGLPVGETIERIRDQGGLVFVPHPFATLCDASLGSSLSDLLPRVDAIEVCNSQNLLRWEDGRAIRFARKHGLTPYVGADVHLRGWLCGSYQLIPDFDGPASFLRSLRSAELFPAYFNPIYTLAMIAQHVPDKLLGLRLPGFGANMPVEERAPATG